MECNSMAFLGVCRSVILSYMWLYIRVRRTICYFETWLQSPIYIEIAARHAKVIQHKPTFLSNWQRGPQRTVFQTWISVILLLLWILKAKYAYLVRKIKTNTGSMRFYKYSMVEVVIRPVGFCQCLPFKQHFNVEKLYFLLQIGVISEIMCFICP